jgi:hypothetical protein
MKEMIGTDKQKKLAQIVLNKKEVSLLIKDIENLTLEDTRYKSTEKLNQDRKIILETPWDAATVLQNKNSKISDLVDMNLAVNGITDVSAKRIFSALRAVYKSSNSLYDNERAEII